MGSAQAVNEIWAHCDEGHEWIVAKLPMEAGAAARQMQRNGRCPHCLKPGYVGRTPPPRSEPPIPHCFAALGLNPRESIITRSVVLNAFEHCADKAHPNATKIAELVKHRDAALKLLEQQGVRE